jgi:hypothetical protein
MALAPRMVNAAKAGADPAAEAPMTKVAQTIEAVRMMMARVETSPPVRSVPIASSNGPDDK